MKSIYRECPETGWKTEIKYDSDIKGNCAIHKFLAKHYHYGDVELDSNGVLISENLKAFGNFCQNHIYANLFLKQSVSNFEKLSLGLNHKYGKIPDVLILSEPCNHPESKLFDWEMLDFGGEFKDVKDKYKYVSRYDFSNDLFALVKTAIGCSGSRFIIISSLTSKKKIFIFKDNIKIVDSIGLDYEVIARDFEQSKSELEMSVDYSLEISIDTLREIKDVETYYELIKDNSRDGKFIVKFDYPYDARTLYQSYVTDDENKYYGYHTKNHESGWTISGEIHYDWAIWVNEFSAEHPVLGRVYGDFEKEVIADFEEGYNDFINKFPIDIWDYQEI